VNTDPEYQQAADKLYDDLASGEWSPGDKIAGISELMSRYNVNSLNTIRRAQAIHIEAGLLRAVQGVGVFVVAVPPPAEVAARKARIELRTAMDHLNRARVSLDVLTDALQSRDKAP
jgi:DNA-binding GntR family transcriptional regulator